MLKNRIQYLILLLVTALIYIFTNEYFMFLLFIFFLILPALSLTLLLLSYKGITVEFDIPPVLKRAEAASICFTLRNPSFFPISGAVLHISCRNQLTGKEIAAQVFSSGHKKINFTSYTILDGNAGRVSVALKKIRICDFVGLFSLSKKVSCEKSGLIYPEAYHVRIAMENPAEIFGDGDFYSQTKKGQDVNEIFALREYSPGDEIRKIHWKLSAKQGKFVVRDYGFSHSHPVFLLLELFNSDSENSAEVLDTCMTAFISVSQSLIENGICHNIAWYDSENEKLMIKAIESMDEFETYLPDLLSMQSYRKDTIALKFYNASEYCRAQLALYYITTKVNREEVAERELYQTVKTIYVTENAENNADDLYFTAITPQNSKEEIEDITI